MPAIQPTFESDIESDLASFDDLLLPEALVRALGRAGFKRPSPVQRLAIPLGRFGADLIVQAKSGTGKTLTYGAICAELVSAGCARPQALVLEPTRELVLQTLAVVSALLSDLPGAVACGGFVGGLPLAQDVRRLQERCQVVVGTPGRLRALLEGGSLPVAHVRTLVLDEADHLLTGHGFLADVAALFAALPARKQVMAFSATYPGAVLAEARALMRRPQTVLLCAETAARLSIRQLYRPVAAAEGAALQQAKQAALLDLVGRVAFPQAVVFCNDRDWAERVAAALCARGVSAAFLCGTQQQRRRMAVVAAARAFRTRALVATDLAARGLDLPQVALVVNLDVPRDYATYMHRVGRTGRFGKRGVAVSIVAPAELESLRQFLADGRGGQLQPLPEQVPRDWYLQAGAADQSGVAAEAAAHSEGAVRGGISPQGDTPGEETLGGETLLAEGVLGSPEGGQPTQQPPAAAAHARAAAPLAPASAGPASGAQSRAPTPAAAAAAASASAQRPSGGADGGWDGRGGGRRDRHSGGGPGEGWGADGEQGAPGQGPGTHGAAPEGAAGEQWVRALLESDLQGGAEHRAGGAAMREALRAHYSYWWWRLVREGQLGAGQTTEDSGRL